MQINTESNRAIILGLALIFTISCESNDENTDTTFDKLDSIETQDSLSRKQINEIRENLASSLSDSTSHFNFETIDASQISVVDTLDSLTLNVVIARYDSSAQPEVSYWKDDTLAHKR